MARIRSIKPEFFSSPSTGACSYPARLLYIAMWTIADDWGVGEANPKMLAAEAFPFDEISSKEIPCLYKEIADNFQAVFYEVHGRKYFQILNWDKHQVTQRRAKRRYPTADNPFAQVTMGIQHLPCVNKEVPCERKEKASTEQGNRGTGEQGIPPIVPLPGDGVPEPATGAALAVVHDTTTDSNDGEDYPTWEKLPIRGKSRHYPADFLEWHQAYPHEREAHDKKAQYRAWRAATRRDTVANILDGTRRYAADPNRVPTYTPAAARWLRKDGWRESALPSRTTTPYTRSQQAAAADFARLQQAKQDQHNQDMLQIGGAP